MNNNRYFSNKKAVRKNRILKTTLGITLAAVLMVQGMGTSMHPAYIWAAQTEKEARTMEEPAKTVKLDEVYLDGTRFKPDQKDKDANEIKEGNGTSAKEAVRTLEKAMSLVKEKGTIYIIGTVTIDKEVKLMVPEGVKVKPGKDFKGPMVKILKKGKLIMTSGIFTEKEVDLKEAELGKEALEVKKLLPEDLKPEEKPAEKPEEDTKAPETVVPEEDKAGSLENQETKPEEKPVQKEKAADIVVPSGITMKEPAALKTMSFSQDFKGNGTFSFEQPELIPEQYETECKVLFAPADLDTHDYSDLAGWDAEKNCVIRTVNVYVESLKAPEVPDKDKETEKEEADKTPADKKPVDKEQTDKDSTDKNAADKDTADKDETESQVKEDRLLHKDTGIRIKGAFIPEQVEIRVSRNDNTKVLAAFGVEEILEAYEIKLWDTESDKEYKIPKDSKATVMIPVPEGAEQYEELVVEHYVKETDTFEYFKVGENLQIKDGYLIFETKSLSPFNVGGNQLVGIGTDSPNHKTPGNKPSGNKPSGNKPSNSKPSKPAGNTISKPAGNTSNTGNNGSTLKPVTKQPSQSGFNNPHTGDESHAFTYMVVGLLALAVILAVFVFGRKRK